MQNYNQQAAFGPVVIITWEISYQHFSKQWIRFEGVSILEWRNEKIVAHIDYFDLGAALYEPLPLIGRLVSLVKKKAFKEKL